MIRGRSLGVKANIIGHSGGQNYQSVTIVIECVLARRHRTSVAVFASIRYDCAVSRFPRTASGEKCEHCGYTGTQALDQPRRVGSYA